VSDPRFKLGDFFAELSRRKVIRVAIVYGVVGFTVIEAADIIDGAIGLPDQFVAFIIVAVFLGFPVAIVLAWAYDIVPDSAARQMRPEEPSEATRGNRSGVSPARAIVFLALAVIAAVSWYEFRQSDPPPPDHADAQFIDSLAVLPLDNLTGDPAFDHIGVSLAEAIITHLAKIRPLKVISRHSAQAAKARNLAIPQIADALGVRHIIEGSFQFDSDRILITLQHIDSQTDAHLWAQSLDGPLAETISVQEDVARFVTTKVVDLIPGLSLPTIATPIELGPAQKAFIEGKQFLSQRTAEGLNNAIYKFENALELDQSHAPAHAALASAYSLALFYRYDVELDGYTIAAKALKSANKAIELDRNLPDGFTARGLLGFNIGHSPNSIAADFDRAEQLSPNSARNPSWRSLVQAQLGNSDIALAEAARAVELDPLSPARQIAVATVAFELGRYEQAIAASRIATALEPKIIYGRAIEARSQILAGRPEQCANLMPRAYRALRATCLAAVGRNDEAKFIIDRILEDIEDGRTSESGYTEVITYEELATYFGFTGDAGKAQEYVMMSFAASPAGMEFRLLDSPLFDAVRSNHNFNASVSAIRSELFERVKRLSETTEAS
jgi:adenylate cyclase